ncbi:hypothetical protein A3E42_03225 [Candidatus Gottesmanbacteria bacterium RIFCSPHIGHO2_12_FULL_40_13]|nr:MAG: hypothetical protein A3E42_03225 [Candidatus Gottesmanbacteria bacterium RIFCSPHIGHO2_12_FULL_40_13]
MNLKEIGPSEVDLFDPYDRDFVKMIRGQKKPAKIFRLIKAKVKLCSSSPEVKKHLAGIYMSKMSDNLAQGFNNLILTGDPQLMKTALNYLRRSINLELDPEEMFKIIEGKDYNDILFPEAVFLLARDNPDNSVRRAASLLHSDMTLKVFQNGWFTHEGKYKLWKQQEEQIKDEKEPQVLIEKINNFISLTKSPSVSGFLIENLMDPAGICQEILDKYIENPCYSKAIRNSVYYQGFRNNGMR